MRDPRRRAEPSATRRLRALPDVRRLSLWCAVAAVPVAVLLVVQWALVAHVVTTVFDGRSPADAASALTGALVAWGGRSVLLALRDGHASRVSARVRADLRRQLVEKLLRLGPEPLEGEQAGELVTTATGGIAKLDGIVARLVPAAMGVAVVPVLIAATVLVLDPESGALLVVGGPLVGLFLWLIGSRAGAAAREQWASLGQLGALLVDTLRTLPTLVTYGRARETGAWLGEVSETYRRTTMRVLRTAFLSGSVLELGATLCTALVAVNAGVRVFEGHLPLRTALLVLLLTPEFFAPLRAYGADRHAAIEGTPAAERILALLDRTEPARGSRPVGDHVPHLHLSAVTVERDGHRLLDGLELDVPPGARIAVVGPSGAGKTSLARVLLGLSWPTSGAVLVDGVPLPELDPDAWRARLAYVPERPWLLAGSVADNVRLGRPEASTDEVWRALARARALPFVDALPHGLDTLLGEDGARLSGGERLRIALARAFVADARVVVLDEATSQLDDATEAEVLAAVDELADGRTLVTITHRRAPLAGVDRVVALDDGALTESDALLPVLP